MMQSFQTRVSNPPPCRPMGRSQRSIMYPGIYTGTWKVSFIKFILPTVVIAISLVISSKVFAGQEITGDPYKERLQKLEDEKQIYDLIMEYGQLLDTRDLVGFSRLFASNGEWSGLIDGKLTTVKGPDEILAMMEKAFGAAPYDPQNITSFHLISNVRIKVDGSRATAFSRWTFVGRDPDNNPFIRLGGHYDDIFIRESGEWKFLRRDAPREIP